MKPVECIEKEKQKVNSILFGLESFKMNRNVLKERIPQFKSISIKASGTNKYEIYFKQNDDKIVKYTMGRKKTEFYNVSSGEIKKKIPSAVDITIDVSGRDGLENAMKELKEYMYNLDELLEKRESLKYDPNKKNEYNKFKKNGLQPISKLIENKESYKMVRDKCKDWNDVAVKEQIVNRFRSLENLKSYYDYVENMNLFETRGQTELASLSEKNKREVKKETDKLKVKQKREKVGKLLDYLKEGLKKLKNLSDKDKQDLEYTKDFITTYYDKDTAGLNDLMGNIDTMDDEKLKDYVIERINKRNEKDLYGEELLAIGNFKVEDLKKGFMIRNAENFKKRYYSKEPQKFDKLMEDIDKVDNEKLKEYIDERIDEVNNDVNKQKVRVIGNLAMKKGKSIESINSDKTLISRDSVGSNESLSSISSTGSNKTFTGFINETKEHLKESKESINEARDTQDFKIKDNKRKEKGAKVQNKVKNKNISKTM